MNVLLLSWNFPPVLGGIEMVVGHLFRGLCKAGHEVTVLAPQAEAARNEPRIERASTSGISAFLRFCMKRGACLCRTSRPDVIVCGSIVSAPAAWILSRRFRIPYVILMHGSDISFGGWFYQRAVRFLVRQATRLAANSQGTKTLLEAAGCRRNRVDIVHPGVDVDAFGQPSRGLPTQPGLSLEGRRLIVTVGRLIQRKGVLDFITHILPDLVKTHPDVFYLAIGEDATRSLAHKERMRDRILAKIKELGLEPYVCLPGKLPEDDLRKALSSAVCFLLPAIEVPGDVEGFGIVFLEAALCGAPAVSVRIGGIPDAVQDGVTGLLSAPGDREGLLSNLRRILDEPDLRDRLAIAAAERARNDFSWDAITRQYIELFERAIGRR